MLKGRPTVLIVATMDTKGEETLHLKSCLMGEGVQVVVLDAGIRGTSPYPVTINREKVASAAGKSLKGVQTLGHEGKALEIMTSGATACTLELYDSGSIRE